jgi:serine/threonine protein kinase
VKLAVAQGTIPSIYYTSHELTLVSTRRIGSGGFAEVYKGVHNKQIVAVKALSVRFQGGGADPLRMIKVKMCSASRCQHLIWAVFSNCAVKQLLGDNFTMTIFSSLLV